MEKEKANEFENNDVSIKGYVCGNKKPILYLKVLEYFVFLIFFLHV